MNVHTTDKAQILKNNLEHTIFSWSKQGGLDPINVERAEGCHFWDWDGKQYLDFSSQLMNVNIGHGNQRITEAVAKQMREVSFVYPGMTTAVRGELGKMISDVTPEGLNKTFFTLGGAEAIENAIKVARMYTGKTKIITQYRSYHGATYGAMSASGDPRKFPMENLAAPGFVRVENPYAYRCPWDTESPEACGEKALANLKQVITYENPENIAAILFEGESGSSGCIKYPPGYMQGVRKLADEHGILLISDEVMSGFGRTGKWFGIDNHGVAPDIMVIAKGLTSGYVPLGGVVLHDKIAHEFDEKALLIGLTYSAHPVSCAAGVENLRIMHEGELVNKAANMGKYVEMKVDELKDKHPSIGDFRNTGLLGCIELVRDRKTKEGLTPWNAGHADSEPTYRMAAKIRELGMFTFVKWNFIFIAPPLIITQEEVDQGIEIISQAIDIADEYYTGP